MKLKFKKQGYQTSAVEAVADCFAGQPKREGLNYRLDPGRAMDASGQAVAALVKTKVCDINLAVEMETGTGKTYCYVKSKHVYFVAETKGSMSSVDLRKIEESKIECARKFFTKITSDQVKYDVVDSYGKLMELVA